MKINFIFTKTRTSIVIHNKIVIHIFNLTILIHNNSVIKASVVLVGSQVWHIRYQSTNSKCSVHSVFYKTNEYHLIWWVSQVEVNKSFHGIYKNYFPPACHMTFQLCYGELCFPVFKIYT